MQNNNFIRILLVEDDALVSFDLSDRLKRLGFSNIIIYEKGEEAIENFSRDRPDVVVMDIALAGALDGIETARRLKNEKKIPVIFLTDYVDEKTFQRSLTVYPADFLPKPFVDVQVARSIKIALQQKNEAEMKEKVANKKPSVLVSDGLFAFKGEGRFEKISLSSIRYLEAGGAYCNIFISGNEPVLVSHSMKTVFEILKQLDLAHSFVQIHRSYIVNTSFITGFQGRTLYLDDTELPVGEHFISDLRKRFFTI